MGWLTLHTLDVDHRLTAAHAEADLEQEISLALWRMDTKLAPIIAVEVARPPEFFTFWKNLPNQDPFAWKGIAQGIEIPAADENIYLNFEVTSDSKWYSPQVPQSGQEKLALQNGLSFEEIAQRQEQFQVFCSSVSVDKLIEQLPEQTLPQNPTEVPQPRFNSFFFGNSSSVNGAAVPQEDQQSRVKGKADNYLGARNRRYQDFAQQELTKQRGTIVNSNGQLAQVQQPSEYESFVQEINNPPVIESVSRPIWVGEKLLLARRVSRNGQIAVQGSWLDWPKLKKELLAETQEELPSAELVPVFELGEAKPNHMLAGLPVQLVVANEALPPTTSLTIRWALRIGWIALLVAVAAVGLLLWGVISLSERRATFVSSVTHELRSPLTTFRMYADMLSRGMVPDADKRQEYLETLNREAQRLSHLVENVLSYARLERGRSCDNRERLTVNDLFHRLEQRLCERANQAEMEFVLQTPEDLSSQHLTTDVATVEQILFNLVDNACKYAIRAQDRRIHCQVESTGHGISFSIRDHGPGFDRTRSFSRPKPFSKSSEEAAVTAPGVGLGLALCSRLAKQLGGSLEIGGNSEGAVVTLRLPLTSGNR